MRDYVTCSKIQQQASLWRHFLKRSLLSHCFNVGVFSFSSLLLWELVYDKTDLDFGLLNRGLGGDFFKSEVITHKGYYSKCMTRTTGVICRTPNAERRMQNAERRMPNAEFWSAEYHVKHVLSHSFTECHRITDPVHRITDKKLALKETIVTNNDMSKNNKQTAVSYKRNETTHVVKTFIYELDVSYAPTYIFRSNGYLNYN